MKPGKSGITGSAPCIPRSLFFDTPIETVPMGDSCTAPGRFCIIGGQSYPPHTALIGQPQESKSRHPIPTSPAVMLAGSGAVEEVMACANSSGASLPKLATRACCAPRRLFQSSYLYTRPSASIQVAVIARSSKLAGFPCQEHAHATSSVAQAPPRTYKTPSRAIVRGRSRTSCFAKSAPFACLPFFGVDNFS